MHAKHAILFVVDGMRPDGLYRASTPAMDALVARGSFTWRAQTITPSISLPCHSSMFRSVPPSRHGIADNVWTPQLPLVPSIIDVVHQAGLGTASFYSWEPLRDLSAPESLDLAYYLRDESTDGQAMLDLSRLAAQTILDRRPAFAFVYLAAPDNTGHRYGWMSAPYLETISQADQAIGLVLDSLAQAGMLAGTACIVQADHGGHDFNHDQGSPEDLTIPWIIAGPGIRQGHQIAAPVHITDTAPTLARLLGLSEPAS